MSTTEEALKKAMEQKADEVRVRGDSLQHLVEEAVRNALAGSNKAQEQDTASPSSSSPPERYPEKVASVDESGKSIWWYNNFNSIMVNIKLKMGEMNKRAIIFCSSVPGEGTTTICSNLALASAKMSAGNVLLMDCNSKHPDIHKIFKTEANPGLTDILLGKINWEDAVRKSNRKNFFVLPFGQSSQESFSLLVSGGMDQLLKTFKTAFDFIFLDAPPILGNPEAETIAPWVDASVLIVEANATRREVVIKAAERMLGQKDFLGAIYNKQIFVIPKFLYKRLK